MRVPAERRNYWNAEACACRALYVQRRIVLRTCSAGSLSGPYREDNLRCEPNFKTVVMQSVGIELQLSFRSVMNNMGAGSYGRRRRPTKSMGYTQEGEQIWAWHAQAVLGLQTNTHHFIEEKHNSLFSLSHKKARLCISVFFPYSENVNLNNVPKFENPVVQNLAIKSGWRKPVEFDKMRIHKTQK